MMMTAHPHDTAGVPDLRTLARGGVVHFVGIGGAGMSALAELVLRAGGQVSGCDAALGESVQKLASLGTRGQCLRELEQCDRRRSVLIHCRRRSKAFEERSGKRGVVRCRPQYG